MKCEAFCKQTQPAALYSLDIYALDSLLNSITDFHNNLDIGIHKLSTVESEISNIRQNQSILDFCEILCNRQAETRLSMHRVSRLQEKGQKLQQHLAQNAQKQNSEQDPKY